MTYYPLEWSKPDPGSVTDGQGTMQDYIRRNIQAIVDHFGAYGGALFWDMQFQDTDGTYPPTTPESPDQAIMSRTIDGDAYELRARFGYVLSGAAEGEISNIRFDRRVNAGAWDVIGDTDAPLGRITFTYDANGNLISYAWD